MSVDHRGPEICVSEQLLNGSDIRAALEQMRRKGVSQGVTGSTLGDAAHVHGRGERTLDDSLMQVMPPPDIASSLGVGPGRREYPLPRPFTIPVGQLARECVRQRSAMETRTKILRELQLDTFEMDAKRRHRGTRRSLSPLPERTMISLQSKSASLTRRERRSETRVS